MVLCKHMGEWIIRIVSGLVVSGLGVYTVMHTETIIDFFGTSDWADSKLGGGGTRLVYKLIGIVTILLGFLAMFNLWNAFLAVTLGSFLPGGS